MAANEYTPHIAQQAVNVTQRVPTEAEKQRTKYKKTLYKLGMTELVLGVICILASIASLGFAIGVENQGYASYSYYSTFGIVYVCPGIWCGIFPIVSGILGICAGKHTSSCMYAANMIMAIFTAIFMAILFSISVPSAIIVTHPAIITFQILNSMASFTLLVVSIVHSAYCCAGVCCVPTNQARAFYAAQPVASQQYVQLANGQYMPVQSQPARAQTYIVAGAPTAVMPPQQGGFVQQMASVPYPQPMMPQPVPYPQPMMPQPNMNPSKPDGHPPSYDSVNSANNPNYPQ